MSGGGMNVQSTPRSSGYANGIGMDLERVITLPVSRVFVSTRTTSSWWATSFTCFGRLGYNRKIRFAIYKIYKKKMKIESKNMLLFLDPWLSALQDWRHLFSHTTKKRNKSKGKELGKEKGKKKSGRNKSR